MRAATRADFEEEGGLYWPPYGDRLWFADRAASLRGRFVQGKTLVVGCGWGYTVHYALGLGMDAWGCDVSAYALQRATDVLPPGSRARLMVADATSTAQMDAVRTFAGLRGNQRFAGAVTEDMLGCLTDAEVAACLTEVRRVAQSVLHVITCGKADDQPGRRDPALVWRTQEQWKAIVAPDLVLDTETGVVL